jgi:hypothetical protein
MARYTLGQDCHMKHVIAIPFVCATAVALALCQGQELASSGGTSAGQNAPSNRRLVQPGELVHVGSFKVPADAVGGGKRGFEYGGGAPAYNPGRDSLFLVGHDWDQFSAEISIPQLNGTARVLQPLADAVEGRRVSIDEDKVGGQLVYNGQLILTKFGFYDATVSQLASHFVRPLDLSIKGQVKGPHRIGPLGAGFYSGYMAAVPAEWQRLLGGPVLTGNCCLSILSRTSYGPAAAAMDPSHLGVSEDAVPLVYYTPEHQTLGAYGAPGSHPVFNGSTRIRGLVFPEGTASVLFFGATGIGNYCYGYAPDCGAPGYDKGEHAYPYRAYVWAYDANDLAASRAGKVRPWNVKPYATWELPLANVEFAGIGGAAYDPATGRIFVTQRLADGGLPLIHIFRIEQPAAAVRK